MARILLGVTPHYTSSNYNIQEAFSPVLCITDGDWNHVTDSAAESHHLLCLGIMPGKNYTIIALYHAERAWFLVSVEELQEEEVLCFQLQRSKSTPWCVPRSEKRRAEAGSWREMWYLDRLGPYR